MCAPHVAVDRGTAARRSLVGVCLLEPGLVRVRMGVGVALTVVLVLVGVLDVIVVMGSVLMGVDLIAVGVLMAVGGVVNMVCGHGCSLWGSRRVVLATGGCSGTQVIHVTQRLVEQRSHMGVVEPVHDMATAADPAHQVQITQDPQLVRHCRLFHADLSGQLAHGVVDDAQASQDADPARGRQRSHHPRNLRRVIDADWAVGGSVVELADVSMLLCTCVRCQAQQALPLTCPTVDRNRQQGP